MTHEQHAHALRLLERWVRTMQTKIIAVPERPELVYYGDGSGGWGVQTNQKAFAAFAVAAAQTGDPELLRVALGMLRYSLATHLTGDQDLTDGDGTRWGHTWISILGIERMFVGIEAIDTALTAQDRAQLRMVLLSEAEYQLSEPVHAGIKPPENKPESNAWNGALLLRVSMMYPDAPQADAFRQKGTEYLINAISIPEDATDNTLVEGKPVKDWFIGPNFTENMALNHHYYMNLGYMVITLSQHAMLHFSMRAAQVSAPDWLYRHTDRLWQLIRSLLFPDGRMCRIGGDSRVRYCYCQDYLLHVLLFARDVFGEEVDGWLDGWIHILDKEMAYNDDGTFLSKRTELFVERSPLYYTRLESDRAVSLAFILHYDSVSPQPKYPAPAPLDHWQDDFHGAAFVRSSNRIASFVWVGSGGTFGTGSPIGICIPANDSSLAEWHRNLTGNTEGSGIYTNSLSQKFAVRSFPGGFLTYGYYTTHTNHILQEQRREEDLSDCYIAYAALPDDATVLTIQFSRMLHPCHCLSVTPLHLMVPNDVFNDFNRKYVFSADQKQLTVDDHLTVQAITGGELFLRQPPYRQIGLSPSVVTAPFLQRGMLHCDEITIAPQETPHFYQRNDIAFDFSAAVTVGSGATHPVVTQAISVPEHPEIRAAAVLGQDGNDYVLIFNVGRTGAEGQLLFRDEHIEFHLAAGEATLHTCK